MASTYSGGPLLAAGGQVITRQDRPAEITTNAVGSATLGIGDTLNLRVSGDGGATWANINFVCPFPFGPFTGFEAQQFVDACNLFITGFGNDRVEWFVPETNTVSGLQIGVRTAVYTGPNAVIQILNGTAIPTGFDFVPGSQVRGVEGYTDFLIQPSPGDPFTAVSVNNYETGLRSRDYHITHKLADATNSKGHIFAESTNGVSIKVSPVAGVQFNPVFGGVTTPFYQFDEEGIDVLDNTYLDVPGQFAANTWYYVYVYYFTGGLLKPAKFSWEVSATPPNVWKTFKAGDTSRKYLFPFRTNGVGVIHPFQKEGFNYKYTTRHGILTAGSGLMDTTVDATSVIPPTSVFGLLRLFIDNSANGATGTIRIGPDRVSGVTGINFICNANETTSNIQIYVPTGNQKFFYKVGDANTSLGIDVWGFRE